MNRTTRIYGNWLNDQEKEKEVLFHAYLDGEGTADFHDLSDFYYHDESYEELVKETGYNLKERLLPGIDKYPRRGEDGYIIKPKLNLNPDCAEDYIQILMDVLENEIDYAAIVRPYIESRRAEKRRTENWYGKESAAEQQQGQKTEDNEDTYERDYFRSHIDGGMNEMTIAYIEDILTVGTEGYEHAMVQAIAIEKEIWKEKTHGTWKDEYWDNERKTMLADRLKVGAYRNCTYVHGSERAVLKAALDGVDFQLAGKWFYSAFFWKVKKGANLPRNEYGERVLADGWCICDVRYPDMEGYSYAYNPEDPEDNPHIEGSEKSEYDDSNYDDSF